MCMNTSNIEGQNPTWNIPITKTEEFQPDVASYSTYSSENSVTSCDDNDIIEFGPIKVKPRKTPAPTLATGRRSKYEVLGPEEEQKRDMRRARNRAAAERVRINRLNVEQQLQDQIDTLEEQEQKLSVTVQILEHRKLHLVTRLITHQTMCHTTNGLNPQNDLMPASNTYNPPILTTYQQMEQISELNLDDILSNSSPLLQNQQDNYSNSLTTLIPGDDFDDIFMNP